jgi:hypothetical protein
MTEVATNANVSTNQELVLLMEGLAAQFKKIVSEQPQNSLVFKRFVVSTSVSLDALARSQLEFIASDSQDLPELARPPVRVETKESSAANPLERRAKREKKREAKRLKFTHEYAQYKDNIKCMKCNEKFDVDNTTVDYITRDYTSTKPNYRGTCAKCVYG